MSDGYCDEEEAMAEVLSEYYSYEDYPLDESLKEDCEECKVSDSIIELVKDIDNEGDEVNE